MKRFIWLALLLWSPSVYAADIGCGRDTDRSGAVDNYCTGDDADNDGYTTAEGDCDDNNWQVYPGISVTSGCEAGEYRTCKAAGTGWTSCTATASTPFCPNSADTTTHSGAVALNCYYFDPVGGSNSNAGTYASPWKTLAKISEGQAGVHNPVAGDAFILLGGSYEKTATVGYGGIASTMRVQNKSGTSTNRIWMMNYPGQAPALDDHTADFESIYFYNSDYWVFSGIEIDGNDIGGKFLLIDGDATTANPNYTVMQNMYVHDVDCIRTDDGSCGMRIQGGTGTGDVMGVVVRNSYFADNIDQEDTAEGSFSIAVFRAKDLTVENNVFAATSPTGASGMMTKHSNPSSSQVVTGNYFFGFTSTSISVQALGIGAPDSHIHHNLFVSSGMTIRDFGGPRYVKDVLIEYNTFVNIAYLLGGTIDRGYDADGSSAADTCTGDYYGPVTIRNNIIHSNAASYPSEARLIEISTYGADSNFTTWITGGLWSTGSNCYYNSNAVALSFALYASNDGNTSCSGRGNSGNTYTWAEWQALGQDASSYNEDPTLSSIYKATSTNCAGWGYRNSSTDGASVVTPAMRRSGYNFRRVLE